MLLADNPLWFGAATDYFFNQKAHSDSRYTYMKKAELKTYHSPIIEVCEIVVEQCISGSVMEDIGGEKDPIEWDDM